MNLNKKFLNWSAWLTLMITYVLPYHSQSTDGLSTYFGYPFSFLTVHSRSINTSLLMTETINLLSLTLDILILYSVINFANAQLVKARSKKNTTH